MSIGVFAVHYTHVVSMVPRSFGHGVILTNAM